MEKVKSKYILFIFLLTFIVWNKTLSQTFLGEGYFYFERWRSFISPTIGLKVILSYDNFARLFFEIVPIFFADNLFLYQLLQLITFSVLTSSFYFIFQKIIKNNWVTIFASIFLLSSLTGTFEMIADGNYDRFVQRVPNIIPMLFSFYFMNRYFNLSNKKNLIFSVLLFICGLFMAHFSIIMLPLFGFYPLIVWFSKKTNLLKHILISCTFILLAFALVYPDPYHSNKSFISFIKNEDQLVKKIIYQITPITVPYNIIPKTSKIIQIDTKQPHLKIVSIISLTLLSFFTYSIYYYYKNDKKIFVFYSLLIVSIFGGLVLYFYSDDKLNPFVELSYGRQYFIFIIYISLVIPLTIKAIVKNKTLSKLIISVIALFIIPWNYFHINEKIKSLDYKVQADRSYIKYVKKISTKFTKDSIIFTHSPIHWPNYLVLRFYAPYGAKQVVNMEELNKLNLKNYNDVFVFSYDYNLNPDEEPDAKKGELLDLTNQFRNKTIDLSSW